MYVCYRLKYVSVGKNITVIGIKCVLTSSSNISSPFKKTLLIFIHLKLLWIAVAKHNFKSTLINMVKGESSIMDNAFNVCIYITGYCT